MPAGADCVAMQEHCSRDGDRVTLTGAAHAGQHLRRRGEELRAGAVALATGTALGPAELSLVAACGAARVTVHRRPRVAILVTGDELVPAGEEPPPGKIVETNSLALAALVAEAGAEPVLLGIAGDSVEAISGRLAAADADALVTTGGASVGDHDHAQESLERLGGALVFHRVAIRPGKPVLFGTASGGRLVFGLPGNPAAAMLCFQLFVRLALRRLAGDPRPELTRVRAKLSGSALARIAGLTFFPRGRLSFESAGLEFKPGAQQSSMQIASWAATNAVACIPPGEGRLAPGDELEVWLTGAL